MDRLINNLNQRVPIQEVIIPSEIDSEPLLSALHSIAQVNPYYVKTFLSKLFKTDIDQDEFFELFSEILSAKPLPVTQPDIVTYNIDGQSIRIRETPRVISGSGTTGLRTWEAALYLSLYLSSHKEMLQDKSVLELGTGTGLVGLYALLQQSAKLRDIIVTDGDSTLIESLSHNFQLNNIDIQKIKCHSLWWGTDRVPEGIDTIIAADVTYDSSVIPALVDCIENGLNQGVKEAYIAATIRNEETIAVFEQDLKGRNLHREVVDKCEVPGDLEKAVWFAKTTPEIRIYKITK